MPKLGWFQNRFRSRFGREGVEIQWAGKEHVRLPLSANPSHVLTRLMGHGAAWAAVEELWAEGLVRDAGENRWVASYEAFDRLGEEDNPIFEALGWPCIEPLDLRCRSVGSVTEDRFRIVPEIHHPKFGILRDGEVLRVGSVFVLAPDRAVRLTPGQRRVFDEAASPPDGSSLEDRMAYLARVRAAAVEAGARLDGYLSGEEYEFADKVGLDLREDGPDEMTLVPVVEGLERFDPRGGETLLAAPSRRVFTRVEPAGRRRRLVVGESVRSAVGRLPPGGKVRGPDVPRLLTNPEQIVPEGFDLSLFSERVKGIRTHVYNSRPYIHVRRVTGGWFEGIPGIEIEDWTPGDEDEAGGPAPDLSPETYAELARRAKETGEEFQRWGDGWVRVAPREAEKFVSTLAQLPQTEEGTYRIPAGTVLEIYENLDLLEFVDPKSLESLEESHLPEDLPEVHPPSRLKAQLYPHQLQGYRWLARLEARRFGGLLADDMGLGKTIQVISHVLRLKEGGEPGPHLVVVPKTLLENWEQELRRFADGPLRVVRHFGGQKAFSPRMYDGCDIVLTTYETLRRDQARLATVDWNLVVCDEAQYVKNPTAQRTSALKALKSKHRVALSGTPVENGLIEFWCIMDFVQPGLLGSWREFRTEYEKPISEGEGHDRERKVRDLLARIRGHYLRRLKEEIFDDLPPKHTHERLAPLGEAQFDLYRRIAREGRSGGRGAALAAIGRLIRLCAHPCTVDPALGGSAGLDAAVCPKLWEALRILEEVREREEKALIFTDFKAVQRILRDAVRERFGIWPDIVNGELTGNRQAVIDLFSEKPGFNVLILGHQVAGVGLNITAANHVIHYTRPWNPAKENQATDRAHRIGQTKPVHVYYPIVVDERFVTVERRLAEVIESKSGLAKDVLRPSAELTVREEDLLRCLDVVA